MPTNANMSTVESHALVSLGEFISSEPSRETKQKTPRKRCLPKGIRLLNADLRPAHFEPRLVERI